MNVALVILHADPAKGGAETYTVDLARALADRGHRVSMLAATFSDALDPRVERVTLPHAGPTRLTRYLSFLDGLDAHLAEELRTARATAPAPSLDTPGEGWGAGQNGARRKDEGRRMNEDGGVVASAHSSLILPPSSVDSGPLPSPPPGYRGRETEPPPGGSIHLLADADSHGQPRSIPRYDVVHAMLPVRRCDLYHPHAGIAAEAVAGGHLKHRSPLRRVAARLANRVNRKRLRFAAVERELLLGTSAARSGASDDHTGTRAASRPPLVICLSDYIKATVRRHYPLPDEQLATLVNAVDLAKFDPAAAEARGRQTRERLGITDDQVVALIVAQDFARKGLREAIEAWRLVADPRLVLLVVGKDDFGPYAKLAGDAPHPANLKYAGPTADVRPFYAAADLFALPTRHDPCSLVVLEALAMGLPVISTTFNGACEVMAEGVHGFVLPDPADVPALADALRRTLDDRARAAMHDACLALRPRLAYGHHLDELLRLYRRVSTARPGGIKEPRP